MWRRCKSVHLHVEEFIRLWVCAHISVDATTAPGPIIMRFLVLRKSLNLFNLWDLLFTYFQFSQIIWWLFLKIFYLLLPKIEICSDTFWTKNPQNQPLWAEKRTSLCCVMPTETRGHSDTSTEFFLRKVRPLYDKRLQSSDLFDSAIFHTLLCSCN